MTVISALIPNAHQRTEIAFTLFTPIFNIALFLAKFLPHFLEGTNRYAFLFCFAPIRRSSWPRNFNLLCCYFLILKTVCKGGKIRNATLRRYWKQFLNLLWALPEVMHCILKQRIFPGWRQRAARRLRPLPSARGWSWLQNRAHGIALGVFYPLNWRNSLRWLRFR